MNKKYEDSEYEYLYQIPVAHDFATKFYQECKVQKQLWASR